MKTTTNPIARLVAGACAMVAVLAVATPAFAHVEAEGEAGAGAGVTTVTFSFDHGCGESPTTSLRIQLPDNADDVVTEDRAGWTADVTANEIQWVGTAVPNGEQAEFVTNMKLTGAKGDVVFFPTIQGCVVGENSWIDKSEDPEAENAAPRITIGVEGADTGGDHDAESTTTSTAKGSTATAAPTTTAKATGTTTGSIAPVTAPADDSRTGLIIAAVILALIVIAGIVALIVRNQSKPTPGGAAETGPASGGDAGPAPDAGGDPGPPAS
jgi:uncharacterized protein YcnI